MAESLVDITRTYPGVRGRKLKKALRKTMTYDLLGYLPMSPNRVRRSDKHAPRRGDRVLTRDGRPGTFVGIDPTGKIWCAMDEYRMQFPFRVQCYVFDFIWRE